MNYYKRLTARNERGELRLISGNQDLVCPNCGATSFEAINRLCELEDKIGDGRLIELPCKIGDTLYTNFRVVGDYLRVSDRPYSVKVVFIGVNNSEEMGGGYINVSYGENRSMWQFTFADIGKRVFSTKLEAEEFV